MPALRIQMHLHRNPSLLQSNVVSQRVVDVVHVVILSLHQKRRRLAGLLHCSEEGWGSGGDAFVCAGRACVWATAHEVSDNGMASVGGDVAGDDRDDFGVGALGSHTTKRTCRSRSSGLIAAG